MATGPTGSGQIPALTVSTGNSTNMTGYTPAPIPVAVATTKGAKARIPTYTSEYYKPDINSTQFVTNQVYQSLLGRNATQDEINKYHEQFLEYAKTHPIFTRQAVYDTSGSTGLSPLTPVRDITAQKTPLSEIDFISNVVRQGPEAKGYQAATTYFDAMRQAMGQFRGGY
jgi:hypothetical protein